MDSTQGPNLPHATTNDRMHPVKTILAFKVMANEYSQARYLRSKNPELIGDIFEVSKFVMH